MHMSGIRPKNEQETRKEKAKYSSIGHASTLSYMQWHGNKDFGAQVLICRDFGTACCDIQKNPEMIKH